MFWEKSRDKKVRQAFQTHPRYHRLNIEFDGDEPRLDDTASIPELKNRVDGDASLVKKIDRIANCFIAALFYFELDAIPLRANGKYMGSGRILCEIRRNNPAFQELFDQLSSVQAQFLLNGWPIATASDPSCFGKDGNFRKQVSLNTEDGFTITLVQGTSEPSDISRSPFSVEKLIEAQGLDAYFGRSDHRKRKVSSIILGPAKKRRRLG